MKHYLSIIIPCFNSLATLEEALRSVYDQHLRIPFEVILFDDGSTDGTNNLIHSLQKKYEHVKVGFHTTNKGGGATRNDAVAMAKGNLIFPLDSDDILPPDVLPKMIAYLDQKNCDGVVFEESKFFRNSRNKTNSVKNTIIHRNIVLKDLLDGTHGFLTQVNFLYCKKAFVIAHGYPEHYDFDTQGYGYRFLSQGQRVYVCPDTYYYHRQGASGKSYYERTFEKGLLSINLYYIFEDIVFSCTNQSFDRIIKFDIFKRNESKDNVLKHIETIKRKSQNKPKNLFVAAIILMQHKQWMNAKKKLLALQHTHGLLPIIQWNIIRCELGYASKLKSEPTFFEILQKVPDGLIIKRNSPLERNVLKRGMTFIRNIVSI